ncbi:MAG: glycosyltransferase family 87 protein [Vicinamibacterales bacterium]
MPSQLRPFVWPLLFLLLAGLVYRAKVQREMVDFDVYRTAARRAVSAEPLYRTEDGHYQFKYLPAFALVMAPFGLMDREAAKAIWFALSAGLLTALVRWSVRALPERRRPEPVLLWITALLMLKFYAHELTLGQTNILFGIVILGGLLAAQIDQPHVAGALIGAAVFIKPYALLLLPWIAFASGVSAAATSFVVVVAGLVLPAFLYGWTGNVQLLVAWFDTVRATTSGNLIGVDNVSLASMWVKWVGIGAPASALATITTGAVLGLVATVWVRRQNVSSPEYLECALLMLLVPLLSPQGWDYVLLLGTPAVALLVDRWRDVGRPWRVTTGLCLGLMGLTVFDLMGRALYGQFMAWAIVTLAALGTAVALAHLRWRSLA